MRLVIGVFTGAMLFALVDASGPTSPLAFLAAFAAALLVAAALGGLVVGRHDRSGSAAHGTRSRAQSRRTPRALDPDGAGRPRPRAPAFRLA
ncbi:hypothetical protein AB0J74_36050 [Asanoa sp. NPDC049573]|uniref:hypothetical protein n=1 Tax=Asanoa sp. NPDC049573 TaxID=3155396 RepID=UPI00343C34F4